MPSQIADLYPHLSGLDEYSLDVAAWIHETIPEWMQHASAATFNECTYLKIELPAPVPMPEATFQEDLVIETSNEEITVAFGGMHTHFGGKFFEALGQSTTVEDTWTDVQTFIEDLMAERKIVTVSINHWGSYHSPDDERYPFLPEYMPPTYTRSWRGTYNRVYDSDAK